MIFTTDGKYITKDGRTARYLGRIDRPRLPLVFAAKSKDSGHEFTFSTDETGDCPCRDFSVRPVTVARSVFRNVFGSSFHLGGDRKSVNECNLRAKRRDAGFGSITDDVSIGVLEYKYEDDKLIGLLLHTDVG